MKKFFKRTLSLFLVVVMTLGVAPLSELLEVDFFDSSIPLSIEAKALTPYITFGNEDDYSYFIEDGWIFYIFNDEVSIVDYENNEAEVVVPSTLGGYPVVELSSSLQFGNKLESIYIPDSVKYIGGGGIFSKCVNLTEIIGCNNIEYCGRYNSWTCIFSNTAYYNDKSNWTNGLLYVGSILAEASSDCGPNIVIKPGTTCVSFAIFSDSVISYNEIIKSVWFPKSVVSINEWAFDECENLERIEFEAGSNLKEIQRAAFWGCEKLDNFELPHGITSLGNFIFYGTAFYKNYDEYEYAHPDNEELQYGGIYCGEYLLDMETFWWDSNTVNTYTIKDGTIAVANGCQIGEEVEEVIIPNSVKYLGSVSKFDLDYQQSIGGSKLKRVNIPSSVIQIGNAAFYDSKNLTYITIPNCVTTIGWRAFSRCGFTSITIPETVEYIGEDSFSADYGVPLTEVKFTGNSKLISISNSAFYGSDFESFEIPTSVKYIGSSAFGGCTSMRKILIPKNVEYIMDWAFNNCNSLEKIEFEQNSHLILIADNVFQGCTSLSNISFANCSKLIAIGCSAFAHLESLLYIRFNDNIKYLGQFLLYGCKQLNNITLPSDLIYIGSSSFAGCESFTEIVIPASVTEINDGIFNNCTSLHTIYMYSDDYLPDLSLCPNLTTLVFDEKSDYASGHGSTTIKKIYLSTGISYDARSFKDCENIDIYFEGTEEDWGKVWIYGKEYLSNSTIHFNSTLLKSPDRVSGISLPNSKVQMTDNAMLMEATVHPETAVNKEIIWTSSNPNVANFYGEDGVLIAYNNGFTVITATTVDGGYTDSCIVFVDESAMILRSEDTNDVLVDEINEFNITLVDIDCISLTELGEVSIDKISDKSLSGITAVVANSNIATIESMSILPNNALKIDVKGVDIGSTYITLTNTNTGEIIYYPISVYSGEMSFCYDTIPQTVIEGRGVENFSKNGLNIYDFKSDKNADGSSNVSFNVYNVSWNIGVVEIFDEDGMCVNTYSVSAFDNNDLTSVKDNVERFGVLVTNIFKAKDFDDVFDITTSVGSAHTPINTVVPKNGYIRITNDISASDACLVYNMVDISVKVISAVESIDLGDKSNQVTETVAKTITEEISDSFEGTTSSFFKKLILEISKASSFNDYEIFIEYFESFLSSEDIDFNEIFIEVISDVLYDVAEDLALKSLGTYGEIVSSLYSFNGKIKIMHMLEDCQYLEGAGSAYIYDNQIGNQRISNGIIYKGDIGGKTIFRTYAVSFGELYDNLTTQNGKDNIKLYEISMIENGDHIQPSSKVQVRIPIPNGWIGDKIEVYRVTDNNSSYEDMNAWRDGDYMVFETDHFSYYVLVNEFELTASVRTPSTTTISYGDSIILHADLSEILPYGWYIEWTADNGNFSYSVSDDGTTCTISPSSSGDTTFTVTVYDSDRNAVSTDEQEMTSKAGFFDKIIAFFKKLFGLTKTIPQVFKGVI